MNDLVAAGKILTTMVEKLGFEVELETSETEDGPCLNMITEDSSYLIGKHGDRLEDLQYLMNRILVKHYPDSPRVRVDCDNYRANQEKQLRENAIQTAQQVIEDGKTRKLKPLNAYYRRLAYNALLQVEGVKATSPSGRSRYKRITIEKSA